MDLITTMQLYFHGEKVESVLIVAVSVVLLVAAVALLVLLKHPFARGLAVVAPSDGDRRGVGRRRRSSFGPTGR